MIAGSLKAAIFCMFLACRQVLDRVDIFTGKLLSLGGTEILFDEVELLRVTRITFLYLFVYCFQAPFLKWNGVL